MKTISKGNLEYRQVKHNDYGTDWYVQLTNCPACGIEFKGGYHRASHIGKHKPEHFGLTPMGKQ
jgi:hypothetical protein